MRSCRSQRRKVRKLPLRFARDRRCFVAHSQVDGQIGTEAPVVQNIAASNRLPYRTGCDAVADWRIERCRLILQKRRQASKDKLAGRTRFSELIIPYVL